MEDVMRPFLLQFARQCLSPGRGVQDPDYIYDESVDMVRWLGNPERPPAIKMHGQSGPMTKKNDIEKSDDNKDRRMWR